MSAARASRMKLVPEALIDVAGAEDSTAEWRDRETLRGVLEDR